MAMPTVLRASVEVVGLEPADRSVLRIVAALIFIQAVR